MHLLQRFVLCILVAVPMPLARSELYEGDSCTIKSQSGVCKVGSQCPELEKAVIAGTLTTRDIVSCGLSTVEEIICCPTERDKVVADNRSDDKYIFEQTSLSTTPSTTTISTPSIESTEEDFWVHLLNTTSMVYSRDTQEQTTTDMPFLIDLRSTTSTSTTTTPTTTTTTPTTTTTKPKKLTINGKEVDFNERYKYITAIFPATNKRTDESSIDQFEKGPIGIQNPYEIWNAPQFGQFIPIQGNNPTFNNNFNQPKFNNPPNWRRFQPSVQESFGRNFDQMPNPYIGESNMFQPMRFIPEPVMERSRSISSMGDAWNFIPANAQTLIENGIEEETNERPNYYEYNLHTPTTTPPLVLNGKRVDPNQDYFDLQALLSGIDGSSIDLFGNMKKNVPQARYFASIGMHPLNPNPKAWQSYTFQPIRVGSRLEKAFPKIWRSYTFEPMLLSIEPVIAKRRRIRSTGDEWNLNQQQQKSTDRVQSSLNNQDTRLNNGEENAATASQDETTEKPDFWDHLLTTTTPEPLVLNGKEVNPNGGFIDLAEMLSDNSKPQDEINQFENIENNRSPQIQRFEMPLRENDNTFGIQTPTSGNVNFKGDWPHRLSPINMPAFRKGPPNLDQPWTNSNSRENTIFQLPFQPPVQQPIPQNVHRRPNLGLNFGLSLGLGSRRIRSIGENWGFLNKQAVLPLQSFKWQNNQDPSLTNPNSEFIWPKSGTQNTGPEKLPLNPFLNMHLTSLPKSRPNQDPSLTNPNSEFIWPKSGTQNTGPERLSLNPFLNMHLTSLPKSRPSTATLNDSIAKVFDFVQSDSNRFSTNDNIRRITTARSATSESSPLFRFPTERQENVSNRNGGWRDEQSNSKEYIDPRRVWGKTSKTHEDGDDRSNRRPTTTTRKPTIAPVTTRTSERPAIVACREIDDGLGNSLTQHILGGTPAELGEFPHMAVIGFSIIGNDREFDYRCGATLIAKRFVLTAAHCVTSRSDQPAIVLLGMVNLTDPEERRNAAEIPIRQVHIHPEYSNSRTYHDIAILELEREVTYTDRVYPTCLYTDLQDPSSKLPLYVTGFGKISTTRSEASSILLKAKLEIVPVMECNTSYVNNGLNRRINEGIQTGQLCANDPGFTRDACQGDSGGPLNLVLDESVRKYRVVGVVSAGFSCGSAIPGLYARVAAYLDFIESIVWPN